ncbi:MAG: rRNA maturation RNase YbeY [Alphaproteobacteria bacterium]
MSNPLLQPAEIDIKKDEPRWETALPDYDHLVKKAVFSALAHINALENSHNLPEISITLCNDSQIQKLNALYRGKDKPTNVLSFPQIDWSDENWHIEPVLLLGDIVISLDTIEREAQAQNKSLANHFIHMIIHSVVHLCGYDHENDKEAEEMETLEIEILNDLGIENPYQTF